MNATQSIHRNKTTKLNKDGSQTNIYICLNRQLQQRGVKHLILYLCFHVGVLGARLSAGLLQQAVTTSADL